MSEPFISVIVPAYNSEKTIRRCIESLLNVDYPGYEIIIVDDGSIDRTKQILFEYEHKIQVIEGEHIGPSRCRNIALEKAKGDFIAFTDSDCIVERNWLSELLKGFTSDKVAGSGGIQLSPSDETNFGKRVQEFFELTGFLGGYIKSIGSEALKEVPHNPSCNAMYRKDALIDIGGFDEKLWPCEDVDLDYRLTKKGHIFVFNPKAIVYHYRPQSLKALLKMMLRYGKVQGILTRRYGIFRKIQIIAIFLTILIIAIFISLLWLVFPIVFFVYTLFKMKNLIIGTQVFILALLASIVWILGSLWGLLSFRR
jgi:cellulose synthase/poly-beta-1,6-N-acetylglucosamine synthase-like glycosyltransferase